ncbi:class I SAM-dependent methyltransferase [bacterium]|nr:class I SAM-dependent methyltransferase [candidate division CSSED10-310 bacterium]
MMEKGHEDIYSLPEYYDIAFDFRDVAAECTFMSDLFHRLHRRAPGGFLELAAGPARHALEFARRGCAAIALDCNEAMTTYTARSAEKAGVELVTVCGDMVDFQLQHPVDMAALLMNSAVYLLTNETVLDHLDSVAGHLTDGGLYILEMAHPRDVFGTGTSTHNQWRMEKDGTAVEMTWGRSDDAFDPVTQIRQVTVTMSFKGPRGDGSIIRAAPERCFTANEVKALVAASGRFELIIQYGAMDAGIPFTNDAIAWRMVSVLRKR